MSRVLTFARYFPAYHPRAGEPTHFVEKLWAGWLTIGLIDDSIVVREELLFDFSVYKECDPKYHTIRAGNRWKIGDKFSPRQWSGKAYRSKQVIIGPDIEVKKVWRVSVINRSIYIEGAPVTTYTIERLAINDGLSFSDLLDWFMPLKKNPAPDWHGQIICWNDKIEY